MREITLWKRGDRRAGCVALVDDWKYDMIRKHDWFLNIKGKYKYAITIIDKKHIYMHHFILPLEGADLIDHKDGNGLNNQEENLRRATKSQNMQNSKLRSDNKNGHRGISYVPHLNKWNARIYANKIRYNLGYFPDKEKAVEAYNIATKKYFGEFSN